jgi:hypothetical protein
MSSIEENNAKNANSFSNNDNESRESAKIIQRANGDVLGVTVALSASDLRRLGINPDETDAVQPRIQSGVVLIQTTQS